MKLSRRNFLRSTGVAGAVVAVPVVTAAAVASAEPKKATWDELMEKSATVKLSEDDLILLGSYINRSRDPGRVLRCWGKLQKNIDNLFALHPYIEGKVVLLARDQKNFGGDTFIAPTYCDRF